MEERIDVFFKRHDRTRIAELEGENAVLQVHVAELDKQVRDLQVALETLAIANQQMISDMKIIYDSLNMIAGKSDESPVDKYFVSIINNNGGGDLPH